MSEALALDAEAQNHTNSPVHRALRLVSEQIDTTGHIILEQNEVWPYVPDYNGSIIISATDAVAHYQKPLPELPIYPSSTPDSVAPGGSHKSLLQREKADRHSRTAYGIGVAALSMTCLAGSAVRAFEYDQVTLAPIVWGNNAATIHQLSSSASLPHSPGTDVLFIPGTGIKDATYGIADPLLPAFKHLQNVNIAALEEASHPQIERTVEAFMSYIEATNPERVFLWGMSAGGKEELLLATELRSARPDIEIVLGLDSTPFNQDSAFQLRGNDNSAMSELSVAANLYGGPVLRAAIEMNNRKDQYTTADGGIDYAKLSTVWQAIKREKLSKDATSNELYIWQVMLTIDNFAHDALMSLKNEPGKAQVSMVYFSPTQDGIVDESESVPLYKQAATDAQIPFYVERIDSEHAAEFRHPDLYINAINAFWQRYNDAPSVEDIQALASDVPKIANKALSKYSDAGTKAGTNVLAEQAVGVAAAITKSATPPSK